MALLKRKELVKSAVIQPEFEEAMAAVVKRKLSDLVRMGRAQGRLNDDQQEIARPLRKFLTSDEERERIQTLLHGLPYEEFGAREHAGRVYLYGLTKPITMEESQLIKMNGEPYRWWDIGQYYVFIPDNVLLGDSMELVHLLPARKLRAKYRHPHHMVDWLTPNSIEPGRSPLDFSAHTCMDDWGPTLVGQCRYLNIPELFRSYYIFLTRYNAWSPLFYVGDKDEALDFMEILREL